jgi:hypothetical protein
MSDIARLRDGDLLSGSDANQTNPGERLGVPRSQREVFHAIRDGSGDVNRLTRDL